MTTATAAPCPASARQCASVFVGDEKERVRPERLQRVLEAGANLDMGNVGALALSCRRLRYFPQALEPLGYPVERVGVGAALCGREKNGHGPQFGKLLHYQVGLRKPGNPLNDAEPHSGKRLTPASLFNSRRHRPIRDLFHRGRIPVLIFVNQTDSAALLQAQHDAHPPRVGAAERDDSIFIDIRPPDEKLLGGHMGSVRMGSRAGREPFMRRRPL
jgi:hypothetical protein